jgi:hypothetical protein
MRFHHGRLFAAALALLAIQGIGASGPPPRRPANPQGQAVCTENPAADYTESVHGSVDGDDLAIQVSGRVAGSIDSLTWRGKEFVNDYDHGREISVAWAFDSYGECMNPTEPGSAQDGLGQTSTSQWLSVCKDGEAKLITETVPAFWLNADHPESCAGALPQAVLDSPIADQQLTRTIEIGYQGLDNVIAFTTEITQPESHQVSQSEIPTGYLTYEFTQHWVFNPATGELVEAEPQQVTFPWSFVHEDTLPPILSTADGQYAMGAYSTEPSLIYYEILVYDVSNPTDRTNKWNIVVHEEPAPAGTYTYHSYLIVGTLEAVQENMRQLYAMEPADLNPPRGYVDQASCDGIDGWAWDPKAQDKPIEIEVYDALPGGEQVLVGQTRADNFRQDLVEALGDNGVHGFHFDAKQVLPDSEAHTLRFYAVNSDPDLPLREIFGSGVELQCAGIEPEPTRAPASPPPPTESATEEPEPTSAPAGGGLPCPSLALPLGLAGVIVIRRRRVNRTTP